MIIIKWFMMKKKEIEVKLAFYTVLNQLCENYSSYFTLIEDLFNQLKDVPTDQIRDQFLEKLAEIVHNEANNRKVDNEIK